MEINASTLPEVKETEQPLLVFHLDQQAYALEIEYVVQIIPMLKLTPVPQAKNLIEGVANIHGEFVPVLDARSRLGLPHITPQLNTPILLVNTGERTLGLIVDRVDQVIHLPAGQVVSTGELLPDFLDCPPLLKGAAHMDEKCVILLDPRHLLNPAQIALLNRAIKALVERMENPENEQESSDPAPKRKPVKLRRQHKDLGAALAEYVADLPVDVTPVDGAAPAPADDSDDQS